MTNMWQGFDTRARVGLGVGCVLIVAAVAALGLWAYRTDYQVLFSEMAPRDAAAMTAELDKMKVPYELGEGGTAILVPQEIVYKTRLSLMAKEVPLHGAVGFEVFNNADFGMTEFVQKVNYLRAIQGELTRTILSIDGIASARVHLAIPEQGLFKKTVTTPKASVTVGMKPGQTLLPEQVAGIQRLVAASVPDIVSGDVTVLDQHGVALTRVSASGAAPDMASAQLDGKQATEAYLVKKVAQVLDQTFGAGAAIASVDVALNLDQGKVTTEEVLPAKGRGSDGSPTGVMVRERHTLRDAEPAGAGKPGAAGNTTSESDYQVGRRVEQLAIAGGSVKRMTIAVVVRQSIDQEQRDRLREVVALAVGLNPARGDAIVVQSMTSLVAAAPQAAGVVAADLPQPVVAAPAAPGHARMVLWVLGALLLGAVLIAALLRLRARRPVRRIAGTRLDQAQREQMLLDVRRWIDTPSAPEQAGGGPR